MTETIPLFPLNVVLFPGGPLTLRIFETRYLDMVSDCLRNDGGFGVVLIREGREVGEAAQCYDVGTLARITYWDRRNDGLLGITVRGEERFRVRSRQIGRDQLVTAEVEMLGPDPEFPVAGEHAALTELLQGIMRQLDHPYVTLPKRYEDCAWVAGRLAELLPLARPEKQALLELDDPRERLKRLAQLLATSL